jgi:hypothetical protein
MRDVKSDLGSILGQKMSNTVGCLCGFTIPSVRSLRHYTCASCSIKYRTTTSTTNIVNERTNIVAPPNSDFASIKRQPTTLILSQINQKRN